MEHVWDKHHFCEVAPSAPHIFSYLKSNPALRTLHLEFEYGLIDKSSRRGVAKFACRDGARSPFEVVWVSASTKLDGGWVVSHATGGATH